MSVLVVKNRRVKGALVHELVRGGVVVLVLRSGPWPDCELLERMELYDSLKASIDKDKCDGCGECLKACTKGAITENFRVVEGLCEGCPSCFYVCHTNAIKFKQVKGAEYEVYSCGKGGLVRLETVPGAREDVYVRSLIGVARKLAEDKDSPLLVESPSFLPLGAKKALLLSDGSPISAKIAEELTEKGIEVLVLGETWDTDEVISWLRE